jgi:hypothetical protein
MMITIVPPAGRVKHPLLFRRHAGEPELPAFLQFDPSDGCVTFGYWERNTEPAAVTLRNWLWWRCSSYISKAAAVGLADEMRPLFERVCAGYCTDWNGRDHTGVYSADAQAALEEISSNMRAALEASYEFNADVFRISPKERVAPRS